VAAASAQSRKAAKYSIFSIEKEMPLFIINSPLLNVQALAVTIKELP
jgi:hypothetical protein